MGEETRGRRVTRSCGTSRRSIPPLPGEHLAQTLFTHTSITHTFLPFFPHLINFYCSNAAGAPLFHLLFFASEETDMKEGKKMLFSHRALIQHAIMPHIRGNRKAIHMQIPISLCTEHRLEKQQPCITDPEQCWGRRVR